MDSIRRQLDLIREELRNVLAKLSSSQKISLLLLAVIVGLGVALVTSLNVSSETVTLGTPPDARDLNKLLMVLDQHQIPYEEESNDKLMKIKVARKDLPRARLVTFKSGVFTQRKSNLDWLFGQSGFGGETRARVRSKLHESRKRDVEDALRVSDQIQDVQIMIHRGSRQVFSTEDNAGDTASVQITLAPGVKGLTTTEAGTIRSVVSSSFNIRSENITVSDDLLRSYHYLETGIGQVFTDQEEGTRARILLAVQSLYSRMFLPSEFVVGVLVDVSQRKQHVVEQKFEPKAVTARTSREKIEEKGGTGSGNETGVLPSSGVGNLALVAGGKNTGSRVESNSEFEARFPQTKTETQIPAGELKGVSVSLVIDRNAALRKIEEHEGRRFSEEPDETELEEMKALLAQFADDHKTIVAEQLPMDQKITKVNVATVSFPTPKAPSDVAFARQISGWLSVNWKDLGLGVVALFVVLALFGVMRRAVPAPIEIPSLEERVLIDEEKAGKEQLEQLRQELSGIVREDRDEGLVMPLDEIEKNLEVANTVAGECPDSVASVIRTWMSGATSNKRGAE